MSDRLKHTQRQVDEFQFGFQFAMGFVQSDLLSNMDNASTEATQQCVRIREVVDIMKVNVDKVLERDAKLSELDDRADQLQAGAAQFDTNAHRLKRKMWWQNCKMWIILIVVIVVIIAVIAIWVAATQ